jgi:drug/metabolite transporter (DMT)-like permease
MPADWLGILFALTSALAWGGGDFCGGAAARRNNLYQVLPTAALSGLALLLGLVLLCGEAFPSPQGVLWAALAGASGAAGMAALYRALALGHAASVAPTSAVIGAALPVIFGGLVEGLPGAARLAGFGLAFAGIWLVSRTDAAAGGTSRRSLLLACLAGAGFGGFFILIAQVERGLVFSPLVVSRCLTLGAALLLLRVHRLPWVSPALHPYALIAGLLDAGGNMFYVLARQFTRLDAAAVLSSLFPAGTVILARIVWREPVTRTQWLGLAFCLAAIALIIV